jgi:hypothetical protein
MWSILASLNHPRRKPQSGCAQSSSSGPPALAQERHVL